MGGRRRRRRNSRREQASAPEAGGDRALLEREAPEGGEILRRSKEMMEAMAEEWGTESTAEEAGAGKKKRKKVVKTRLPQALMEHMIANPCRLMLIPGDLPDDELAKRPRCFRQFHAAAMDRAEKVAAYEQALVDQYLARGYAEDETKVTDDDEEEDKN